MEDNGKPVSPDGRLKVLQKLMRILDEVEDGAP